MKTYICISILLYLATIGRAEIKFVGYGAFEGKPRYALCDDGNSQAAWVAVGDEFSGHRVERFDSEQEELWLSDAGGHVGFKLACAHIKSARQWDPAKKDEFLAILRDMQPRNGRVEKLFQIADYISMATSYGLVVVEWRSDGNQEVIRMQNPAGDTSASVKRTNFTVQLKGHKEVPNRRLTISIIEANRVAGGN